MPRGDWIETYLGKALYPLDPDFSIPVINIIDMGHSLANQCRFLGHVREFYSIAQHSVFVSELVEQVSSVWTDVMWGLLHDGSEYGLGDMPRPLKKLSEFDPYRVRERVFQNAICTVFGLPLEQPECVTHADLVALATEARDLMAPPPQPWNPMPPPSERRIVPLSPKEAEKAFLDRYWKLRKTLGEQPEHDPLHYAASRPGSSPCSSCGSTVWNLRPGGICPDCSARKVLDKKKGVSN